MLADILAPNGWGVWHWHSLVRLVLAAALAGLIGMERERQGAAAGFRTIMLVGIGSALAMVVSIYFAEAYGAAAAATNLRIDPARVAYGVMAGVGFLGAGAIIQSKGTVRGLTTAASCWCTAAIGLACGFGMVLQAVTTTGIVLVCLWGLKRMDRRIHPRWSMVLTVRFSAGGSGHPQRLREALAGKDVQTTFRRIEMDAPAGTLTVTAVIDGPRSLTESHILDLCGNLPDVGNISLR